MFNSDCLINHNKYDVLILNCSCNTLVNSVNQSLTLEIHSTTLSMDNETYEIYVHDISERHTNIMVGVTLRMCELVYDAKKIIADKKEMCMCANNIDIIAQGRQTNNLMFIGNYGTKNFARICEPNSVTKISVKRKIIYHGNNKSICLLIHPLCTINRIRQNYRN